MMDLVILLILMLLCHKCCNLHLHPCQQVFPSICLQVLDGALSPKEAVFEIMNLPQIEES
jgi:hypothetical protein